MAKAGRKSADSSFFEILVALIYKRNGWPIVKFIEKNPITKSPDIFVSNKKDEWFVECKRLESDSIYSLKERKKWLTMWEPLSKYLAANLRPLLFDIVFHVELLSLEDDFISKNLIPKLNLVSEVGVIIENEKWTVKVKKVDLKRVQQELINSPVMLSSSRLMELITGKFYRNVGFTSVVLGTTLRGSNNILEKINFAGGSFWSCDGEILFEKKARDIKKRLSEAVDQLPKNKPSIIHVGLDTIDGQIVERIRYEKICNTIMKFDALGKDLHWVFCHLFDPVVPPDKDWDFGETAYNFGRSVNNRPPLKYCLLIVPEEYADPN